MLEHLTTRGECCAVLSPSIVPIWSGDQVKTDRRDSLTFACLHRAGEWRPIYVPDEAMRDLVRATNNSLGGTQPANISRIHRRYTWCRRPD